MPRRLPPPPSTDDSRFFTVVNPYPEQPYLALEDSKIFARWIASIVGAENLFAFYHKPKSPNVVIIELSNDYTHLRRLLGEHRWSATLKQPTEQEAEEVSRIFPCTLTTPWSLEKVRWLHRDVESSWFRNWSPERDSTIVYPYPDSHFCRTPVEDVTRNTLCRPLQEDLFRTKAARDAGNKPVPASAPRSVSFASVLSHSVDTFMSSESDDFDSDEEVFPTPPEITSSRSIPFVPAIHGEVAPKNVVVIQTAVQGTQMESLWANYGEKDAPQPDDLCEVHGAMCSSGICKSHAERKREAMREEREKQRKEEKDAWRKRCGLGAGKGEVAWVKRGSEARSSPSSSASSSRPPSRADSVASSASEVSAKSREPTVRPHDGGTSAKTIGKPVSGLSGGTVAAAPRALPPHLRKGAGATSAPTPATSPSTYSPTVSGTSSRASSTTPDEDDARSTTSSVVSAGSKMSSSASSMQRPIPPNPWMKAKNWQAYAKVARGDDGSSVASSATGYASRNPWKRVAPVPHAAAAARADREEGRPPAFVHRGRNEDEMTVSDFDEEPF